MNDEVVIIGGGLAGSEAAIYLAERGVNVVLYEMRPQDMTPVHKTPYLAELVCSNSLGSFDPNNASGLLKLETTKLGSTLIPVAHETAIPAGAALAVDRELFARKITDIIKNHPRIKLKHEHIHDIHVYRENFLLIATGPLTSTALAENLLSVTGHDYLHFYDAVAPIIEFDSINMEIAYKMDRYNNSKVPSYINCPMNESQYQTFYDFLVQAPSITIKDFEQDKKFFEACMPVEVMAKRGKDTLRYGPMKPVGLPDPKNNQIPYAVVQLRQDNAIATLYNLVGFQTNLKWSAQKELIKLIPGLENVNIIRYGVMHRNTYINSPLLLKPSLQSRFNPKIFFAGQLTGVEGYTESIATGLFAAVNIFRMIKSRQILELSDESILGALCNYITTADPNNFQPMNSNWGIIKPLEPKHIPKNKKLKKQLLSQRALNYIETLINQEKL